MKCSATTDGKQCLPCELLLDLGRFNKNSLFKKVNINGYQSVYLSGGKQ